MVQGPQKRRKGKSVSSHYGGGEGAEVNSGKIILHLCAKEGSDSKPYRDAGYDVRIIGKDIGVENYTPPANVYGIIANPPCTHFSIARMSTAKTPRDLREGMRLVKECLRIIWECQYRIGNQNQRFSPLRFWSLENPHTGHLRWFLGKPVFAYNQIEYGAALSKRTALWGFFNAPKRPLLYSPVPAGYVMGGHAYVNGKNIEEGSRHDDDGHRSRCPIDFAKAFFEANP